MLNVFIGWNGEDGNQIALILENTLYAIINGLDRKNVFVSNYIQKGEPWIPELKSFLKKTNIAFFIFTPNTKLSEWMAYETGFLDMRASCNENDSVVIYPLLFNANLKEIPEYIQSTQHTSFKKDDYHTLFQQILNNNNDMDSESFNRQLKSKLDLFWDSFSPKIEEILENFLSKNNKKLENDLENQNYKKLTDISNTINYINGHIAQISSIKEDLNLLSTNFNSFHSRLSPTLRENGILLTETTIKKNPNKNNSKSKSRLMIIIKEIEDNGLLDERTLDELKSAADEVTDNFI